MKTAEKNLLYLLENVWKKWVITTLEKSEFAKSKHMFSRGYQNTMA